MSKHNDGGPAFPLGEYVVLNGVPVTQPTNGLSLRDYFAAAALPGLLGYWNQTQKTERDFAKDAYLLADAMLAERAQQKEAQS